MNGLTIELHVTATMEIIVSCIAKIVFGAKVDHRVDDDVWSPAQSVDDTNYYNRLGDSFADAYDTLNSK